MSGISALSNVQSSLQGLSQAIAGGNTDPATVLGLASDQNQFKAEDDMTKEVINLISPNKVDVTV